ncbi:MAG: hypothetical protein V3U03_13415 [Myxococcota bacterium]
MGKLFGVALLAFAVYAGITLYEEGRERAFGGAFAPVQPIDQGEAPRATALTPAAQFADPPSGPRQRGWKAGEVRERTSADLGAAARRRGR